jgi:ATP-dependent protease ClpP protease subunit
MLRQPSNLAATRAAWRAACDVPVRSTPCFRMDAAADVAKLYVFGMIGGWDMDAAEFVQQVHAIDAPAIDMHINSPGGLVFDAVSMYEALRAHPATVTTHVDGLAGSAASFLALAGDTVQTAKGSRWMVHDAQVAAVGPPALLREMADLGDEVSNDIAGIYADRAGGTAASWRTAMSATTWYSASEAVDAGLASQVTGSTGGPDNRTRLVQARFRALTA